MSSPSEKALQLLRYLPRVSLDNIIKNPYIKKKKGRLVGQYSTRHNWPINKCNYERQRYLPVGYSIDEKNQWYMRIPIERYYKNAKTRRQYPPFTLYQLQLGIDLGKIKVDEPIDLTTIVQTNTFTFDPFLNHFGVNLTDEGIDLFKARVNIEVQYAKEPVIAAIERNGGVISTAYYDIKSLMALKEPHNFFLKGEPIPRRLLPPEDAIEYYTNAKNRGYLADPEKIEEERQLLAQKYGYVLPDVTKDDATNAMLKLKKDPRQVFLGLEPGWVVNLKDKEILRPTDEMLEEYYKS